MKRRPLFRLAGLAAIALTLSAYTSGGVQYSGMTSMTFQNGVSPTTGYTGCADTYIAAANADTNKNFGSGDSLLLACPTAVRSEKRILIKFDISALPDSAVITNARLWIYTDFPSAAAAGQNQISVWRIYNAWNEGTGTNTGTVQATNADWLNRTGIAWIGLGCITATHSFWRTGTSAGLDSSTTTATGFYGADTLYTNTSNDHPIDMETSAMTKTGATVTRRRGWVTLNVTHAVRLWHIDANQNNGLLLTLENVTAYTGVISYWSSNYTGYKLQRPKLVVEYFDPTSGTNSGGRRVIGSGAGAIH